MNIQSYCSLHNILYDSGQRKTVRFTIKQHRAQRLCYVLKQMTNECSSRVRSFSWA